MLLILEMQPRNTPLNAEVTAELDASNGEASNNQNNGPYVEVAGRHHDAKLRQMYTRYLRNV